MDVGRFWSSALQPNNDDDDCICMFGIVFVFIGDINVYQVPGIMQNQKFDGFHHLILSLNQESLTAAIAVELCVVDKPIYMDCLKNFVFLLLSAATFVNQE